MARAIVKRDRSFDDRLRELEERYPGVRQAAEDFIAVLKISGEDLPAQRFDNKRVHAVDDLSAGRQGRGRFGVTFELTVSANPVSTFTMLDIWVRDRDLPDPS